MVTHHHHTQVATSTSDHGAEKTAEPSSVALRPLHGEDVSVKPRNKRSYMAGGVDCVKRAKYFFRPQKYFNLFQQPVLVYLMALDLVRLRE